MPPWYYRRRWRSNRRRRIPYRRWRFRKPVQRTFRRKPYRVRKLWRKKFKRKLKKITVKEWQPKKIRNCRIKGDLCLFACGQQRVPHNFTLYSESIVPEKEPGGGAWSIMQLTLRALWDEFVKFRNWWTTSNDNLPLVRFMNVKFKFYKSKHTDYIVIPHLCPPFAVTREDYLNTQPIRALMDRRKIIVPRLKPGDKKNT